MTSRCDREIPEQDQDLVLIGRPLIATRTPLVATSKVMRHAEMAIWDLLVDHPGWHNHRWIYERVGFSKSQCMAIMRALVAKGLVLDMRRMGILRFRANVVSSSGSSVSDGSESMGS